MATQTDTGRRPGEPTGASESAAEGGEAAAILPQVYAELRRLAAARLAAESPGQTLQPTALVHEAYLRLAGGCNGAANWQGRAHFFAAAAEAMRRVLVEAARRKARLKHGGGAARLPLDAAPEVAAPEPCEDILALDAALTRLAETDPDAARVVQLRHFAGLTVAEAAEVMGVSPRTADRLWAYARAWLHRAVAAGE